MRDAGRVYCFDEYASVWAALCLPLVPRCAIFRYGGVHEALTQSSVFGRGFSSPRVSLRFPYR